MSFQPMATKKAALARLGQIVGNRYQLGDGSSIPRGLFDAIAREAGVPATGSMPVVAEKIAAAAGLPWGPECDSRHTNSGGGSTLTLPGMNRLIEAMDTLKGRSSAPYPIQSTIGMPYRSKAGGVNTAPTPLLRNWDALDEATREHQRMERYLADFAGTHGSMPRSATDGEPLYDLAWERNGTIVVAEVKSTTPTNHRQQVRLGVGQVIEYSALLEASTGLIVHRVLLISDDPTPDDLLLADAAGVLIIGPQDLDELIITDLVNP